MFPASWPRPRHSPAVEAIRVDLQISRGPIGVEYVNAAIAAKSVRAQSLIGGIVVVSSPLAGAIEERDRRRRRVVVGGGIDVVVLVVKSNPIPPRDQLEHAGGDDYMGVPNFTGRVERLEAPRSA